MARLKFRNFSDLTFIQGIDKPRHLAPLLSSHTGYFDRQGIDVTKLKNDDATDRRLLKVFTQPDDEMPPDLLEALYVLDDLADESGHDRILDEAKRQGIHVIAGPKVRQGPVQKCGTRDSGSPLREGRQHLPLSSSSLA